MPKVPRDDVPEWLQQELATAMAKEPADRHESAGAFADTLREGMARHRSSSPWAPQAGDAQATAQTRPISASPVSAAPVAAHPADSDRAPDAEPDALTQWVRAPASRTAPPAPWQVAAPERPAALAAPPAEAAAGPDDEDRGPSRGRAIAVMSVIGVLFGVVIVAVTSQLGNRHPDAETTVISASPKPEPAPTLARVTDDAVVNVRVEDLGGTIRLTWDNAKTTDAPKLIVGQQTLPGAAPRNMGSVSAGATTTLVNGLNPKVDYCFVVLAVHSENAVGRSKPACTSRIIKSPVR
jgi:hypothetical protein